ncbi:penicillin-binding protein [Nitriliruptoraceae bacterium ZYF776]|nr:penicillin-binding protein [Profundirhabdus halotolerans]
MSLSLSGSLDRRRRVRRIALLVVLLLAGAAVGVWRWLERDPGPEPVASDFVEAWAAGDPASAGTFVGTTPAQVRDAYAVVTADLADLPLEVTLTDVVPDEADDTRATATAEVTWRLPGERTWDYTTPFSLQRGDEGWAVVWSPAVVHPQLFDGGRLQLARTTPPRADVVDADGDPLVTSRPTVDVGIQPSRVEDLDDLAATVADLLDVDGDALADRVEAAGPDQFVPVITLREEDYLAVEDELFPLPGTVFRRQEVPLAPTREFARATLGAAGPVTAEMLEEQPERYVAGDVAGLSGLQRRYDEQLAGQPGLEVRIVAPEPDDGSPAADAEVVFAAEAETGEPLRVTLDETVQRAADAALADQDEFPTALVAIRISDGHVLAAANGPANGGLDLALTGRYPPGSTFKIVSTAALLERGLSPDDEVPCPETATVDGRAFRNAESQSLGDVPFTTAFANSCNTAFVSLHDELDDDALTEVGAAFGLGDDHDLGAGAFTGEVPTTEPGTDRAAAMIGQGRVLASPFAMAEVAATAVRGTYLRPQLVLSGQEAPDARPLPAAAADALPGLLRAVVTDGSGGAVADVPGGPVLGKTGTAEYGDGSPPRTHAWFAGAQDDVAFAVLVAETEDGFGGRLAAPIAADFLEALAD